MHWRTPRLVVLQPCRSVFGFSNLEILSSAAETAKVAVRIYLPSPITIVVDTGRYQDVGCETFIFEKEGNAPNLGT